MPFQVRRRTVTRTETVYVDVRCDRCGDPLDEQPSIPPDGTLQYDNNLVLELHGGYGMFCDPDVPVGRRHRRDPEHTVVLCHDCAHDFADWVGIDVRNWHTHRPGSGLHRDHHDGAGHG